MASTYSSDLKLEIVTTGEKAGLWGTITNTNLKILEQSASGYIDVSMAGASVTLDLTDGAVSNGKNFYLKLSGTLGGNRTLTMPSGSERVFIISDETDRTSSQYTLSVLTASGTAQPVPVGATLLCVSDGTNTTTRLLQEGTKSVDSASITTYTAVNNDQIFATTTTDAITITLPSSASAGNQITIIDISRSFGSNNLTVARNGHKINGESNNLVLSTNGQAITLVYTGTTQGWVYKTNTA